MSKMIKPGLWLISALLVTGLTGCAVGNRVAVNGENIHLFAGDVSVPIGQQAGRLVTTNGNITIAKRASVRHVDVVNGNISVEELALLGEIQTINGNIDIAAKVTVQGNVQTVNGNIDVGVDSQIGESLITTRGDISLNDGALVKGDIVFESPSFLGKQIDGEKPTLTLTEKADVRGQIHLHHAVDLTLPDGFDRSKVVVHYQEVP